MVSHGTSGTPSLPAGNVHPAIRTDAAARAVYSEAAGVARIVPLGVAQPGSVAEVSELVRWCGEAGTPLIARGAGSSMSGGAIGEGLIVDLSRLRRMGDVDVERKMLTTGAGVARADANAAALRAGLRFPPDPSSGPFCTIGGMCATNAAGAHTLRFGATRPWIDGLECVFDDGSVAWVRRGRPLATNVPAIGRFMQVAGEIRERARRIAPLAVRKDSSGYALGEWASGGELVDLLVGSEGTLALFTAAELRLTAEAAATASILAAFDELEPCAAAATTAGECGAVACELLDRTFLDVARSGGVELPGTARTEALLLIAIEGGSAGAARETARSIGERMTALGAAHVQVALDSDAERGIWALRHSASPVLSRLHPALASMQFIEDSAVPPARLPEYVRGVREILDRNGTRGVIFGHAGDAHVHVNPLVDTRRADWRERVERILVEVADLTVRLGGTLAGEHGDGRLRTPLLARVHGDAAMQLYSEVKAAFDPRGILNPGVKIPLRGQRPLDAIKYDPALEPLHPAAARALAHVAATRDYLADRLELLDRFEEG